MVRRSQQVKMLTGVATAACLSFGVFGLAPSGHAPGPRAAEMTRPATHHAILPSPPYAASSRQLSSFVPGVRVAGWLNTDQDITLDRLKGHVVLLSFWAPWCVPCLEKFPLLNDLQDRYAQAGLVVLAVSAEDEKGAVSLLRSGRAKVILGIGARDLFDSYDVRAIPMSVLIGRDGAETKLDYSATARDFRWAVERAVVAPHGRLYSWRKPFAAVGQAAGKLPAELERPRDAWAFSLEEAGVCAAGLGDRARIKRNIWDRLFGNLPPLSPVDFDRLYEFYLRNRPRVGWRGDEDARKAVLGEFARIVRQPNVREDARWQLLERLLDSPDEAAAVGAVQAHVIAALAKFEPLRAEFGPRVKTVLHTAAECQWAGSPAARTEVTRAISYWDGVRDEPVDTPLTRAITRYSAEQEQAARGAQPSAAWREASARFQQSLATTADETPGVLHRAFSSPLDPNDPYAAFVPLNSVKAASRVIYGDVPATAAERQAIIEALAEIVCLYPDSDSIGMILGTLSDHAEYLRALPRPLRQQLMCVLTDRNQAEQTYIRWYQLQLTLELTSDLHD